MKTKEIALVTGDGSGPEMMAVACKLVELGASYDRFGIDWVKTPMGWNAYHLYGDTLPAESLRRAVEIGTIFFGGVGDFDNDTTVGKEFPDMKPEARSLLPIRKKMGLLLNFRPMIYYPELASLAGVKPETIPATGIEQHFIRYLLEDQYFGNVDFLDKYKDRPLMLELLAELGIKLKKDVTGQEELVTDIAYYRGDTIRKYFRAAFAYARQRKLPLISVDKANVLACGDYWRKICTEIAKEFPDVFVSHQLVDSANALLFTPAELHGVIACGNLQGDVLSDGGASALGSMGMMCSSAVNPDTGAAMFESGAGTAPTLAGQDKANPIGRILTGAMMLEHLAALEGRESLGGKIIKKAVRQVLADGYRTGEIFRQDDNERKLLGTKAMGEKIIYYMQLEFATSE